jgi:hypothetical protein
LNSNHIQALRAAGLTNVANLIERGQMDEKTLTLELLIAQGIEESEAQKAESLIRVLTSTQVESTPKPSVVKAPANKVSAKSLAGPACLGMVGMTALCCGYATDSPKIMGGTVAIGAVVAFATWRANAKRKGAISIAGMTTHQGAPGVDNHGPGTSEISGDRSLQASPVNTQSATDKTEPKAISRLLEVSRNQMKRAVEMYQTDTGKATVVLLTATTAMLSSWAARTSIGSAISAVASLLAIGGGSFLALRRPGTPKLLGGLALGVGVTALFCIDKDRDGTLDLIDCNDQRLAIETNIFTDDDCDGTINTEDCDPQSVSNDQSSRNDSDCDGITNTSDCEPENPKVTASSDGDKDCDTVPDGSDCDPEGHTDDLDCDGTLTNLDCNDANSEIKTTKGDDQDCDGIADKDDCDSAKANVAIRLSEDSDCDGMANDIDCDPNGHADDADCDGILQAEDCNDKDGTVTSSKTKDSDCDGTVDTEDLDVLLQAERLVSGGAADSIYPAFEVSDDELWAVAKNPDAKKCYNGVDLEKGASAEPPVHTKPSPIQTGDQLTGIVVESDSSYGARLDKMRAEIRKNVLGKILVETLVLQWEEEKNGEWIEVGEGEYRTEWNPSNSTYELIWKDKVKFTPTFAFAFEEIKSASGRWPTFQRKTVCTEGWLFGGCETQIKMVPSGEIRVKFKTTAEKVKQGFTINLYYRPLSYRDEVLCGPRVQEDRFTPEDPIEYSSEWASNFGGWEKSYVGYVVASSDGKTVVQDINLKALTK